MLLQRVEAPSFIAAQFIIAKYWKQPKCPSANEWIKKLWYIYTKLLLFKGHVYPGFGMEEPAALKMVSKGTDRQS